MKGMTGEPGLPGEQGDPGADGADGKDGNPVLLYINKYMYIISYDYTIIAAHCKGMK